MVDERSFAAIDLDAIAENLTAAKKKAGGAMVMAVIKANAYGHGAPEVAERLKDIADWFGVAMPEEGVQLRKSGVVKPILVLGVTPKSKIHYLHQYGLTPSVSSFSAAAELSEYAVKNGCSFSIHAGVDTGMSRIGFQFSEKEKIVEISRLPGICIAGLCTHYACADEREKSFCENQLVIFKRFEMYLKENGIDPPVKHISNSAGIIEFKENHFNMVRAGIMIYGLYPSKEVDHTFRLRPAMAWIAYVSHVKTLEAGRGVSYGATYKTEKPTVVATIPVGYADGYKRALSGKGSVLIRGQYAKILGRICMDQFMVDVSDIPGVRTGDEAVLIGRQGDNRISMEDVADPAASFNYEFACGIGMRVPRAFFQNGELLSVRNYILEQ